jgi:integrase
VRHWNAKVAKEFPTTAAKAYRLLSGIMRTAVTDSVIVSSPCRVRGAGTEHAGERPVATLAEVQALADAMPAHLKVLVLMATWCQLRRAELFGLRRRNIDLLRRSISVEQTRVVTMKGNPVTKRPKSEAGRRTLSVPPHIVPAISEHLESFVGPEPESLVFPGKEGGPLLPQVLNRSWKKARKMVGRTDLRLHDLRHTGLTLAAASGATVAELMHRAGHASPRAALLYQHATEDRDRVLAEALAELAKPAEVLPITRESPRF